MTNHYCMLCGTEGDHRSIHSNMDTAHIPEEWHADNT